MSALAVGLLRTPEAAPPRRERWATRGEIGAGLRLVAGDPILRAITASAALGNFFANVLGAVLVLYLVRGLHLPPVALGLVFGALGPGALVGALVAARLPPRVGLGRTLVGAAFLLHVGNLLNACAGGPADRAVVLLVVAHALIGFAAVILNVNVTSLAQAVTPDHMLGRLSASIGVVTAGAMPLGALVGGALGATIGLQPTLLVGGIGAFTGFLWFLLSPIRALRALPTPIEEEEQGTAGA